MWVPMEYRLHRPVDMSASATRRFRDGMLSIASLSVVVAGMAAIDKTVRGALVDLVDGRLPIGITLPDLRIQHLTHTFTHTIGLPSDSQFPLLGFGIAALVLFILMFRT